MILIAPVVIIILTDNNNSDDFDHFLCMFGRFQPCDRAPKPKRVSKTSKRVSSA